MSCDESLFDPRQPYHAIPDMIYMEDGKELTDEQLEERAVVCNNPPDGFDMLCRVCNWNVHSEFYCSYVPRTFICYTSSSSALWVVGKDWLLWDRPNNSSGISDYKSYQFLRNQGFKHVPLVENMMPLSKPEDPAQLTLVSHAKGKSLRSAWKDSSPEEMQSYKHQLVKILRELRTFTAPFPQTLDGKPLFDQIIATCEPNALCKDIGKTNEEWFDDMAEELRTGLSYIHKTDDKAVVEEHLQELKDKFPGGAPYVLSHGNLQFQKIIVDDGKIVAILDWERAGYYPWWFERYWTRHQSHCDEWGDFFDEVWMELDPELDDEAFCDKIWRTIWPVKEAWRACPNLHPGCDDAWLRPAFCKCMPHGGKIRTRQCGIEFEHKLNHNVLSERKKYQKCLP